MTDHDTRTASGRTASPEITHVPNVDRPLHGVSDIVDAAVRQWAGVDDRDALASRLKTIRDYAQRWAAEEHGYMLLPNTDPHSCSPDKTLADDEREELFTWVHQALADEDKRCIFIGSIEWRQGVIVSAVARVVGLSSRDTAALCRDIEEWKAAR